MSIRKITFPDHTADDFDENQVFEADNGLKYIWNGRYGWELVDGGIEDYDDQWIKDDQQRQDDALADYKKEVELDQQRQDDKLDDYKKEVELDQKRQDDELADYKKEVDKDQARQDEELEALRNEIFPGGGDSCNTPELSARLVYGAYGNGMSDDQTYFSTSGSTTHLYIPQGVHNDTWPNPRDNPPEFLWVNGEEYGVTSGSNTSGYHWEYFLDKDIPLSLQNTTVSYSLCEPDDGSSSAIFVTHDELAESQAQQDEAWDKDQKRQDDALAEEIAARAERDALHDAQINTIEYKLDALVGLQFKGIYEFKHEANCNTIYQQCIDTCNLIQPGDMSCLTDCSRQQVACEQDKVRPGYFEAVDPDDRFDHLEYIVISKADKAGVEIDWAGVLDEGDYLEVDHTADGVLDKTNYGLYRITEEPELSTNAFGEEVYTLKLQFLQGDGEFNVRENYEIRGITAAEGVNPEELGDFLTKEEATATYALKSHSHSNYSSTSHTHSNYASSSHTHSGYASSSHTHSGYASSTHTHSNMAIMKITTSSTPSLNQGEMAWNKNTYTLYIGK